MVSRRAGIAAGILAALYPNLWMNDGLVMSESVALAFLVTASWLAWRALRQWEGGPRALRSWWSAGAVFGLAALTRSEIALIAVVVVAWCTWRERRCGAWRALVALGLVALPWVAYNTVRFDRQFLLTTNEGGALLGSNCDATWEGIHLGGWSIF